ncbi:MAG: A24 family peptidase [Patescibacteria group bacterium]
MIFQALQLQDFADVHNMTSLSAVLAILSFIVGGLFASFAGVISERLNTGESWSRGRSRCNSCSEVLSVVDLIPVLSWITTRGACRRCRARVPYLYPLTELVVGTLFFATSTVYGLSYESITLAAFYFVLTIIVLYDLRHTVVPFPLSLLLIGLALLFTIVNSPDLHTLGVSCVTAGIIALGFFLMHVLSGGRLMGLGDAPIALALSLVAGSVAFTGLLFSFWIGAAIGIGILATAERGHRMGIEVPFVPFLAAGYLLAFFTQWNLFSLL